MAQVVECLTSKHKPQYHKKEKKKSGSLYTFVYGYSLHLQAILARDAFHYKRYMKRLLKAFNCLKMINPPQAYELNSCSQLVVLFGEVLET
jgi:hypothetical protein